MKVKSLKINAMLNMVKQLCTVLFPLITVPYTSRILHADNYGKHNFANSIVNYFLLLAGLGVTNYAIREGSRIRGEKGKIQKFANEIFTINMVSTIFSYLFLVVLLIFSIKLKQYRILIAIQSIAIILTTLGVDWINSIYEDYLYTTIRYIFIHCIAICGLFLFVKTTEDYVKFSAITVLASYGGNLLNLFYIRKYVHLRLVKKLNLSQHITSILLLFFNSIATTIYINSDTTMLGILQDDNSVGIYSLATKIYILIKQVLNAIIVVSLPRLSVLLGENNIEGFKKLSNSIIDAVSTILFPMIIGLFMLSKEVILLVGGSDYVEGTSVIRILSIALGFAVLAAFWCCALMLPFRQEKICLVASLISAGINIAVNLIAIPLWNYNGAALTTLLSEIIVFFIYLHKTRKILIIDGSIQVKKAVICGCTLIIVVCLIVQKFCLSTVMEVLLSIVLSAPIYFLVQVFMKNLIVIRILDSVFTKMTGNKIR